jgi:hypothetical protein
MNKLIGVLVSAVSFGAFSVIYAHPGGPHKHKLTDVLHYLSDPFHIITALFLAVCAVNLLFWLRGKSGLEKSQ